MVAVGRGFDEKTDPTIMISRVVVGLFGVFMGLKAGWFGFI